MRLDPVVEPAVPCGFRTAAPRRRRVLVDGPTADRGVDDDFVTRIDVENRRRQSLPLREPVLEPDLGRAASRRLQPEVEAAPTLPIRELGERRRLEALAVARVRIEIVADPIDDSRDRARIVETLAAAVVGILRGDVMILRRVMHVARA